MCKQTQSPTISTVLLILCRFLRKLFYNCILKKCNINSGVSAKAHGSSFPLSANSQPLTVFHIKTIRSLVSGPASFSSKLSSLTFLLSLTTVLLVLRLSSKASSTFSHPPESQSLRIRDAERETRNDRLPSKMEPAFSSKTEPTKMPTQHPHLGPGQGRKAVRTSPQPTVQFSSCTGH